MKLLHMHKGPLDFGVNRVVRLQYDLIRSFKNFQDYISFDEHRTVVKYLKKNMKGTWGFTRPLVTSEDHASVYLFFKDDTDYLVFKLWTKYHVNTVTMWPRHVQFTTYEDAPDETELPK